MAWTLSGGRGVDDERRVRRGLRVGHRGKPQKLLARARRLRARRAPCLAAATVAATRRTQKGPLCLQSMFQVVEDVEREAG